MQRKSPAPTSHKRFSWVLPWFALLSACAQIRETPPQINIYTQLQIGVTELDGPPESERPPPLKVLSIEKLGDPTSVFVPSPDSRILWLRDGDYRAKLVCLRSAGEKYAADDFEDGVPLKPDGYLYFSINADTDLIDGHDPSFYQLDCAVTADGKTLFVRRRLMEVMEE